MCIIYAIKDVYALKPWRSVAAWGVYHFIRGGAELPAVLLFFKIKTTTQSVELEAGEQNKTSVVKFNAEQTRTNTPFNFRGHDGQQILNTTSIYNIVDIPTVDISYILGKTTHTQIWLLFWVSPSLCCGERTHPPHSTLVYLAFTVTLSNTGQATFTHAGTHRRPHLHRVPTGPITWVSEWLTIP